MSRSPRPSSASTHIVVTSVDRDDLPDGGASQFVKVIEALRRNTPATTIEILTPDFRNKAQAAVETIIAARPDVYNHNLETVPRLYPTIRPGARYYASLRLLESVKRHDPSIFTKSGVMVGLGEQRLEVHQVMDDMRSADVDFLTMGQYLQPTPRHAKVEEFVTPAGVQRLCRDRPRQGLPARRRLAADPVELSCRRRFREDARRARGEAGGGASGPDAAPQRKPDPALHARAAVRPRRRCRPLPAIPALGRGDPGPLEQRDRDGRRPRRRLQRAQGDLHLAGRARRRPDEIEIDYVEGPLKYLHNNWKFRARRQGGTEVDFCVDFAFRNRLFEALAGQMFDRALQADDRRVRGARRTRFTARASPGSSSSSAHSAA